MITISKRTTGADWQYIIITSVFAFIIPAVSIGTDMMVNGTTNCPLAVAGKWFIFSAVGLRFFVAGIRQANDPVFTAKEVLRIHSDECYPLLRELGFANLCFGLIGIISLLMPEWRVVSAFASGLYYAIEVLRHMLKQPATINDWFALATDLFIFIVLFVYFMEMGVFRCIS